MSPRRKKASAAGVLYLVGAGFPVVVLILLLADGVFGTGISPDVLIGLGIGAVAVFVLVSAVLFGVLSGLAKDQEAGASEKAGP